MNKPPPRPRSKTFKRPPKPAPSTPTRPLDIPTPRFEIFPGELPVFPSFKPSLAFSEDLFQEGLKDWSEQRHGMHRDSLPPLLLPFRRNPRMWISGEPETRTLDDLSRHIAIEAFNDAFDLLMSRTVEPYEPRLLGDFQLPDQRWLIDGWIPANRLTLLHSPPGAGATRLALQLACAVAAGEPEWIPGRHPLKISAAKPADTVYVSWDCTPPELRALVFEGASNLLNAEAKPLALHTLGNFFDPMSSSEHFAVGKNKCWTNVGEKIIKYSNKHKARLIVIDSLDEAFAVAAKYSVDWDISMDNATRLFVRALEWTARTQRRTILLLAHEHQHGSSSDSQTRTDKKYAAAFRAARSALRLVPTKGDTLRMTREKTPFAKQTQQASVALSGYPFVKTTSRRSRRRVASASARKPFDQKPSLSSAIDLRLLKLTNSGVRLSIFIVAMVALIVAVRLFFTSA